MENNKIQAKPIVAGEASGNALYSRIALSFWGGVDAHTGCVIDKRHDLCGKALTGQILCLPSGRGSCSSSGIIVEMIRAETAPAAIIAEDVEGILAVGSVIGKELYHRYIPIALVQEADYKKLAGAKTIRLEQDGAIAYSL